MEHHHRVTGHEAVGEAAFQLESKFLFQSEFRVGNAVSHRHVIFQCHIGDRVGVVLAMTIELCHCGWPVMVVLDQQVNE